jgi:hypothetical protein
MARQLPAYNAVYGFCAGILFLLFLYKLRDQWRSPTDPAGWAVIVALASTAAAFTFAAPAVYENFDGALGSPNAATLVVYSCILLTSAFFQPVLVLWTASRSQSRTQPRVAGRLTAYVLVSFAMVTLFILGHPTDAEHPIDFDAHYAASAYLCEFLIIYYAGFGVAMTQVGLLSRRYAAAAGRAWLSRGLQWIWIGVMFALGYCVLKVVSVLVALGGGDLDEFSTLWAPLSASVGALLIGGGLTMPAWGPRLATRWELGHQVRAYGELYPLWKAMYDAMPDIVLDPPGSRWSRWAIRDLSHRLYRRVIEIRDGRLALAEYMHREATENVLFGEREDPDEQHRAAEREATIIADALQSRSSGRSGSGSAPRPEEDLHGPDLASEVTWLVQVSKAFSRRTSSMKQHGGTRG